MDTRTGEIYRLQGEDLLPEEDESTREFRRRQERYIEGLREQSVVQVSEQVAQAQLLGQRELARRKRRRKAQRQARKRSR